MIRDIFPVRKSVSTSGFRTRWAAWLTLAWIGILGCTSLAYQKRVFRNTGELEAGMSMAEAAEVLGKPNFVLQGNPTTLWEYELYDDREIWVDTTVTYHLYFNAGRLTKFEEHQGESAREIAARFAEEQKIAEMKANGSYGAYLVEQERFRHERQLQDQRMEFEQRARIHQQMQENFRQMNPPPAQRAPARSCTTRALPGAYGNTYQTDCH